MEHVDVSEIARFLLGQLSPERSAQVERHLATCAQCAERAAESQGATEAFSLPEAGSASKEAHARRTSAAPREPALPRWLQEGRPPERGEQVGRYLILERVGRGGMGIVYSAWDPDLGRRVAIKLLRMDRPQSEGRTIGQARLLREAQAMARVTHPHVISVFDVGTLGEGVFVAMEFVDGTTLKRWVKEKPRPWSEVLDAFLAAGRGLAGAHAVGLVHRDFKPDNVLIGKDGRIRVTDFGLARLAEEGAEPPRAALPAGAPVDEAPELAQLTQDGLAVGTLMYMSPEQRRGDAPDARADQFSFCVALYWALYGAWPFDKQRSSQRGPESEPGSSHKGTSRPSQRSEDLRPVDPSTGAFEPPADSKVPAFLRKAILRGLSPDPKDRFPSMEALLAQLAYRPRQMRLAAAAAVLGIVVLAGGYVSYAHQASQRQAQLCTGAEQKLAGIWDEAARRKVKDSLVATGKPAAADMASRVERMLDGYTHDWVEASTEACRATRIRGEQTEQLLSLRVVCLERRLQDVKAVTGVLASADAALVAKAVDAIALLPSLRSCADVTTLSQVEPPPDSVKAREEIARISSQVAQLKALTDAGRYQQGKEVAESAVKAASELGFRPLLAEALLWRGWLESRNGEFAPSERHLTEALRAAVASRHDEVLARAAANLVFTVGIDPKRLEKALEWSELAKAALARMGGNEDIESEVFNNLGVAYARQGRNVESIAAFQQALVLADRALGPEHPRRANMMGNLGNIYRKEGRFQEAIRAMGDALALRERVSGPNHPLAGTIHYSLAQTHLRLSEFEKARAHARRALEIDLETFGPEHPQVGGTYDVVGHIAMVAGEFQESQEAYQKAVAIKEKTLAKDDGELSYSVNGVARSYLELGDPARARPLFERIMALNPPDPGARAEAHFGMARTLVSLKQDRAQALALARKARAEYEQAKDVDGVAEVDAWLAKHASSKPGGRTTTRR
jgi:tetratricopeptide (TPR) repeat protein